MQPPAQLQSTGHDDVVAQAVTSDCVLPQRLHHNGATDPQLEVDLNR